jgi:hypothetical protein
MKRLIYMTLTLVSALSIGGCSSPITTKDLTLIEEAEEQKNSKVETPDLSSEDKEDASPVLSPEPTPYSSPAVTTVSGQSELTFEIEGNPEVVPVREYKSSLGYSILIDEERFTYEAGKDHDLYSTVNPDKSIYPDIYIKLAKANKADNPEYIEAAKQQLSEENIEIGVLSDIKLGDYDVIGFKSNYGTDYNSAIKNIYIIESEDAFYNIETQIFLEAEEGYGARIKALLDTIKINE